MNRFGIHSCAICGDEPSAKQPRFLVAENSWEDKLTILEWDDETAHRPGLQVACGIDHLEELVVHWMTTGSLDYPFARTALGASGWRRKTLSGMQADLSGTRQLGELAVHRESVVRILMDQPQSLQGILDALLEALRQETSIEERPATQPPDERKADNRKGQKDLCAVGSKTYF